MCKIFLSFDFYGAGNLGDDLMLEGFITAFEKTKAEFFCYVPRVYTHQKYRFPGINFIDRSEYDKISSECDVWIGVGDTPVQIKSGRWFLDRLNIVSEFKSRYGFKYFFTGVGVEKEALEMKDEFRKILSEVDHIWTRDAASTELLINNFQTDNVKVTTSSDLANISLEKIFSIDKYNIQNRLYNLGVCYYDENIDAADLNNLYRFLKSLKNKNVLLFGNDVNTKGKFEYYLYNSMFSGYRKYFKGKVKLFFPDYFSEISTGNMLCHFSECSTVMTSRYHAMLTAAWAGCRVVSLERSSKVTALAEELGINEVKKPFTKDKLEIAYNEASTVSREKLLSLSIKASESLKELKDLIHI